jgi:hypothetical protein
MHGNSLSNSVFDNANDLLDHFCHAWNQLEAPPTLRLDQNRYTMWNDRA